MKRKYKSYSAASAKAQARYVGEKLPLYAKGNVVGVQLGNDASYFGTDLMGSVRSISDMYGMLRDERDYDVFGNPLETVGYNNGLEYGYAGKSYDAVTEMYNYGFRDYSPATARFTTLDPIRDGSNWFSYVNNDPVNFVDLWGLMASDAKRGGGSNLVVPTPTVTVANPPYIVFGGRMGEPSKIPNVVVIITFDGTKNQAQAHVGTASVYHTQKDVTVDNYSSVKSNGTLITTLPVVSGGLDKATGIEYPRTEAGFYTGIYPEPTSTSSNPMLKDFDHGGENNSMYRIDRENGIAIHQANNLYSVETSRTEGCAAVTSYMEKGARSNYDLFKYSTEPYGYVPQNGITFVVEE